VSNFYAIVSRTLKLLTFYNEPIFRPNVVIPLYYCRAIFLPREDHPWTDDADGRRLRPGSNLHSRSLSRAYQSLATYKAVVERLTTFRSAIRRGRDALARKPPRIERTEHPGRDLVFA